MTRLQSALAIVCLAAPSLLANPILWTIGPDKNGVPRNLVQFDPIAGTQQVPVALPNGSLNFSGGLVWDHFDTSMFPASFYGPYLTVDGDMYIASVDSTGAGGTVSSNLGKFIPRGTAEIDKNGQLTLWIIITDVQNNAFLTDWSANTGDFSTTGVQLTQGLYSGAAYNTDDGNIYVIKNNAQGNSSLLRVNLTTSAITPMPIVLGTGFTGGLAYAEGQFYSIRNSGGNSTVYRFGVNDSAPTQIYNLGQGFQYASLTATPGPASTTGVPEPATVLLTAFGLLVPAALTRRWR